MDSVKLLIFSDTHGHIENLITLFSWAKEHLPPNDNIVASAFLGDGVADLSYAAHTTGFYSDWKIIRGNNDFTSSVSSSAVFDLNGHRFFMCHGHHHSVRSGASRLIGASRDNNANVVLFGHTHVPFNKTVNGITLINPGSIGQARSRAGTTFAVSECRQGKPLKTNFWNINRWGEITKIKI